MQYDKIFVIGFNKTATSTFHRLFEKNGLRSQHDGSRWDVEEYDCFSDNGNLRDWKACSEAYPGAFFILNIRPLSKWMRSRAKHGFARKRAWAYPPSTGLYEKWIRDRDEHNLQTVHHFRDCPQRLAVVDISKQGWLEFVSALLSLKSFELMVNTANDQVPGDYLKQVDQVMTDTFAQLDLDTSEQLSSFLVKSLHPQGVRAQAAELLAAYTSNLSADDVAALSTA